MKKRILITTIVVILVLFIPIPRGTCKDGGTKHYTAVIYSVVVWNRLIPETYPDASDEQVYHKTSVYWFPNNFKSIDELWKIEQGKK